MRPQPIDPPETPARGRGTSLNPANRFDGLRLEVLDEARAAAAAEHPGGVQVPTRFHADATRSVINRVDSPDLGFHWTVNPYRGCEHACVYCYARPTHEMLGLSCGLDFESKIFAKHQAPRLLRRELAAPRWRGEPIVMSGVTDPYQPVERRLQITRRCLGVMAECRQPVGVVTKSRRVMRDLDLLAELAAHGAVSVTLSVTTLDETLAAGMEPRACRPADRLGAIRRLAAAGIPTGVMIAPVIPGLNDREIPRILQAAAEAGATSASWVMLRLPHKVKEIFLCWLGERFPQRRRRIERLISQVHGGRLYDPAFGRRGRGSGALAEQIARTFEVFARRHGLAGPTPGLSSAAFRRPDGQMALFG